jgi:threonine dehydrogenase-like Zn-dependent dehydrogenase
MRAVVFNGVGDVSVQNVADPSIADPNDILVKLASSAICGTDLHFVRGSFGDVEPGTILGHEGVGIVEEAGKNVRNVRKGDRVVIPSTIACGTCSYCRASYYSKCDNANKVEPQSTAFFGGPKGCGGFQGLQAEYARVPYGNVGPVKVPDNVFPIGKAMAKNLTLRMGDCPHRRYLPRLLRWVSNGTIRPSRILSQKTGLDGAVDAYRQFASHRDGWLKVELLPDSSARTRTRTERGELVNA